MIDTLFFSSKQFLVSAVVASVFVGGAAGVYFLGADSALRFEDACEAPRMSGRAIEVAPTQTSDEPARRRTISYHLNATSFAGGALLACVSVGEILVEPAPGNDVELEFTIEGRHWTSVEGTEVLARFYDDAGRLVIGAWEPVRGETRSTIFGGDGADVRLIVRLPQTGAYDIDAFVDVGDLHLNDLLVGDLGLEADVGSIVAIGLELTGDARANVDVGNAILSLNSYETSNITVASEVGNAEVELAPRVDAGFDVVADADIGETTVRIGATEKYDSVENAPGQHIEARSTGFSSKPTQVTIRGTSDVGDVRIVVTEMTQ